MSARLGFLGGFLALTALDAVVTSKDGAANVGSGLSMVADVFSRIVSPDVPLIPDHSTKKTTATLSDNPVTPAAPTTTSNQTDTQFV